MLVSHGRYQVNKSRWVGQAMFRNIRIIFKVSPLLSTLMRTLSYLEIHIKGGDHIKHTLNISILNIFRKYWILCSIVRGIYNSEITFFNTADPSTTQV